MAFDKNYENRKDWREQYRDSRARDRSCRCNGSCKWCRRNRLHADAKRIMSASDVPHFELDSKTMDMLKAGIERINKQYS